MVYRIEQKCIRYFFACSFCGNLYVFLKNKIKHAAVTYYGITHDDDFHLLIVLHMQCAQTTLLLFMFWYYINTYMLKVSCNTISDYHNRNITIYLKAHLDNRDCLTRWIRSLMACMVSSMCNKSYGL